MTPGEKVRFKEPTEEEKGVVFEVLEDREDRVLVTAIDLFDDWTIKPTSVYMKTDLELVTDEDITLSQNTV
jgi:hypothetical protein